MMHLDNRHYQTIGRAFGIMLLAALSTLVVPAFGLASTEPWPVRNALLVSSARVDGSCLVGPKAPVSLREALSKVPLGVIASPLGELVLEKPVVMQLLGSLARYVELPDVIQIRRTGDLLPGEEIVAAVKKRFMERLPQKLNGRIEMDLSRLPHHVVLPGALKSWDVRPVSQNTLGMVLFSLEADCEGGRVKQILQAEVWKTVEVAKLRRLAKRGEMLRETDLERASVRVKSQSADNVIPFEEAVGRPLATFKSAGTVIRASDILSCDVSDGDSLITRAISEPATNNKMPDYALPAINTVRRTEGARLARPGVKPVMQQTGREAWVVKPGDQVQFGVQVNGLSLTVPARAVEGGAVGDSIRLVNMQNQRSISGKIVAPGKVEHAED